MDDEIPLTGGNVNDAVVRKGNTVRRQTHQHSASIHALLQYLHAQGFAHSPEFLGIDELGREVLTYLPADKVGVEFIWQEDTSMSAVAHMLRQYHQAVAGFNVEDYCWVYSYPDAAQHEVVCHNDFAPYNLLFKRHLPVGIIDFDLAGPGPKLRDVAYAAYWCVPLSFHALDMRAYTMQDLNRGSRRLMAFCQSYGTSDYSRLLNLVAEVLFHMGDQQSVSAMLGPEKTRQLQSAGHLAHWQQEYHAFCNNKAALEQNLNVQ